MSDNDHDQDSINPVSKFWLKICWLIALLAALGLFSASLIFGNLNQDEGWYLYAAGLISSGKMPYRDFAFTQGPVMPFVYSLAYPVIKLGGLAAGRLFTSVLGTIGVLAAVLLAGRLARPGQSYPAAILCFILLLVNVYQVYFCTVVKTYSLTILFLTGAFLALHCALAHRKGLGVMLSAVLLVLAAGTRSSAAVVLPVIFSLLWLERKKFAFPAWIYFAFGGMITAIFVFGPFLLQCAANFIYFAISYHTLRHEGDLLTTVMFKAGFVSRVIQAYFVCLVFWVTAIIIKSGFLNGATAHNGTSCHPESAAADEGSHPQLSIRRRFLAALGMTNYAGCNLESDKHINDSAVQGAAVVSFLRRCIWLGAIAVSLLHLIAPFPYDDYQVFVYPLFAVAVSLMILEALPERAGKRVVLIALCLSLLSAVSAPINQDWFIEGRELIWWKMKDQPPLVKLRQTAARIRALSDPTDLLLTQDPYLAVESGRALPPGLEMGQFSYFPNLTNEQAKKMNVLNRALFADLLQNCNAPLAALSGYAFAIQSPQITPVSPADKALFEQIIGDRYKLFETVAGFGQASTELRLYHRK